MKKFIISAFGLGLFMILSSGIQDVTKSGGPPACYSNEPSNLTSCETAGCHFGNTVNSGSATVSLDLGEANFGYIPGKTYTVTINISKAGMTRAGFQIIALQDVDNAKSPGNFKLNDVNRTQINTHGGVCSSTNKVWIEHTLNGTNVVQAGQNQWTFQWTAPTTGVGNITFYLAALEANFDDESTGDFVYTVKKTINEATNLATEDIEESAHIQVFPNPTHQYLEIKKLDNIEINKLEIVSVSGTVLKTSENVNKLNVSDLAEGLYFLKIHQGNKVSFKRFTIKRD